MPVGWNPRIVRIIQNDHYYIFVFEFTRSNSPSSPRTQTSFPSIPSPLRYIPGHSIIYSFVGTSVTFPSCVGEKLRLFRRCSNFPCDTVVQAIPSLISVQMKTLLFTCCPILRFDQLLVFLHFPENIKISGSSQ